MKNNEQIKGLYFQNYSYKLTRNKNAVAMFIHAFFTVYFSYTINIFQIPTLLPAI